MRSWDGDKPVLILIWRAAVDVSVVPLARQIGRTFVASNMNGITRFVELLCDGLFSTKENDLDADEDQHVCDLECPWLRGVYLEMPPNKCILS